ncbi:MAG: hypothetical protein ACYCOU_03225, partial [Sulfobacillus sp.]
ATVWEHGRNRQHVLANFHGAYSLSWSHLRDSVERNFPALSIDWMAVADTLAQGPLEELPLSMTAWDWARVEYHLQVWAHQPWGDAHERASLRAALCYPPGVHGTRPWNTRIPSPSDTMCHHSPRRRCRWGPLSFGPPGDFPLAKMTISLWHYWRFKPGIIGGFHLAFFVTFKLALTDLCPLHRNCCSQSWCA